MHMLYKQLAVTTQPHSMGKGENDVALATSVSGGWVHSDSD